MKRSSLQKLQEYLDCFMETDPKKELQKINEQGVVGDVTKDITEVALKYLSIALINGVEERAQKIKISLDKGKGLLSLIGETTSQLPAPPEGLTERMIAILREITGIQNDSGKSEVACGFRNDKLDFFVTIEKKAESEELIIDLPKL